MPSSGMVAPRGNTATLSRVSIRLRIPELLDARGWTTYRLAKASGISLSAAYRLVDKRGALKTFPAKLLEALSDGLGVEPAELFERVRTAKTGGRRPR